MLSRNRFVHTKERELNILRRYAGLALKSISVGVSLQQMLDWKIEAFRQMKRKRLDDHSAMQETARGAAHLTFVQDNFSFCYSYQRYNLELTAQEELHRLWRLPTNSTSFTRFANCGMAAINSVLFSLFANYHRKTQIWISDSAYFETRRLISQFGFKSCSLERQPIQRLKGGVLWLDCISKSSLSQQMALSPRGTELAVIDTTASSLLDTDVREIMEQLFSDGTMLVLLVRSHLKLDSYGTDVGRLGSVSVVSKSYTKHALARKIGHLCRTLGEIFARTGSLAPVSSLTPMIFNVGLIEANQIRLKRLQQNNIFFARHLDKHISSVVKVISYPHSFFTTLKIPKVDNRKSMQHLISYLSSTSAAQSLFLSPSGSFGFDFTSIDSYLDDLDGDTIRISIGDLPREELETGAFQFTSILSNTRPEVFLNKDEGHYDCGAVV